MPTKNEIAANVAINASTSAAADTASVVTITAPTNAGLTIYITGIELSASGTIGAAVAVTLTGVVGGTKTWRLPASAVAPIVIQYGVHPLKITQGVNAVLTLPALGAGISGTASINYYIGEI
jgi:hypothetical protein